MKSSIGLEKIWRNGRLSEMGQPIIPYPYKRNIFNTRLPPFEERCTNVYCATIRVRPLFDTRTGRINHLLHRYPHYCTMLYSSCAMRATANERMVRFTRGPRATKKRPSVFVQKNRYLEEADNLSKRSAALKEAKAVLLTRTAKPSPSRFLISSITIRTIAANWVDQRTASFLKLHHLSHHYFIGGLVIEFNGADICGTGVGEPE